MARKLLRRISIALILTCLTLPAFAAGKQGPKWSDLRERDQQILAPLKEDWNNFPDTQRKRLRAVARQYDKMPPDKQQRVNVRMQEWARLSMQERIQARESFFRMLWAQPPEKKQAIKKKWDEYQKLPPEERERLKAERQAKKPTGQQPMSQPIMPPPASHPQAPQRPN